MLTSESKRSIIAALMKTGIADYILKPFKSDELRAKIQKALGAAATPSPAGDAATGGGATAAPGASGPAGATATAAAGAPQDVSDILVVDDMENVQKRLRQMIPENLTITGALTAPIAINICRDRSFRAILIDNDMPDVNSASLMRQIRVLQPRAAILALYLRTNANVIDLAKKAGFDGVVLKPFDVGAIEDFVAQHFNSQDLVTQEENVLKISAFKGRENRLDGYFNEVTNTLTKISEDVAAACFSDVILDVSAAPVASDRFVRLVLDMKGRVTKMGLGLRLVGPPAVASTLKNYSDTADVPLYPSVGEAQSAA
jgi:DNA-binding NarL/FixJ family response regulator